MSLFDPANVFGGGGGPGFRDPLGIFSRGGGPMSQQQIQMRRTMGPQRFDNSGPVFGGAGMAGREGSPPEMGMQAPQAGGLWGSMGLGSGTPLSGYRGPSGNQWGPGTNDPTGEIARQQNNQLAMSQGRGAEIGMGKPQGISGAGLGALSGGVGNQSFIGARKGTGMADPQQYAALAAAMGRRRGP